MTANKGKNRYGLDVRYFRANLSIILRDINNYTPSEMSRALARLSRVAESQTKSGLTNDDQAEER